MKKSSAFLLMLLLTTKSYAGFNGLTIHSRANCTNNESIAWDKKSNHMLLTVSDHLFNGSLMHSLTSGWQNTWRSANVHWGEPSPWGGWHVQAGHYIQLNNKPYLLGYTAADDCSIYDGWWDK